MYDNQKLKEREFTVYSQSVQTSEDGGAVFMAAKGGEDYIIAPKDCQFTKSSPLDDGLISAPLNHENAELLRRMFPFTSPVRALGKYPCTMGIRQGAQIRDIEGHDMMPILQVEEPARYADDLDDLTFSVFKQNYTRGFGADGGSLTCPDDIRSCIKAGYTMLTLDCSGHMRTGAESMTDDEVLKEYVPEARFEKEYLGQTFTLENGYELIFDEISYKRTVLTFSKAIAFACNMFDMLIKRADVDFEVSFLNAERPITPLQHFFIAHALFSRVIRFDAFSPCFDSAGLERDLSCHEQIAKRFGYKLSLRAGPPFPAGTELKSFHIRTSESRAPAFNR